jgi:hypothetical protein
MYVFIYFLFILFIYNVLTACPITSNNTKFLAQSFTDSFDINIKKLIFYLCGLTVVYCSYILDGPQFGSRRRKGILDTLLF